VTDQLHGRFTSRGARIRDGVRHDEPLLPTRDDERREDVNVSLRKPKSAPSSSGPPKMFLRRVVER